MHFGSMEPLEISKVKQNIATQGMVLWEAGCKMFAWGIFPIKLVLFQKRKIAVGSGRERGYWETRSR